jgi:hypothetical protein
MGINGRKESRSAITTHQCKQQGGRVICEVRQHHASYSCLDGSNADIFGYCRDFLMKKEAEKAKQ